jgi:hypothetical protein
MLTRQQGYRAASPSNPCHPIEKGPKALDPHWRDGHACKEHNRGKIKKTRRKRTPIHTMDHLSDGGGGGRQRERENICSLRLDHNSLAHPCSTHNHTGR